MGAWFVVEEEPSLRPQPGSASSPIAAQVSGKRYVFPANDDKIEAVSLETGGDGVALVTRTAGRESRVPVGFGAWGKSATVVRGTSEERVAASGGWTADDTYTARLCLHETPFVVTWSLEFKGDEVSLDIDSNVGFGPTKRPTLVGRLESK